MFESLEVIFKSLVIENNKYFGSFGVYVNINKHF